MQLPQKIAAAEITGMVVNTHPGPDIIAEDKSAEVKFKMIYPDKYTHICWRVLEHQLHYGKKWPDFYWALGTYQLDRSVRKIRSANLSLLESYVLQRTLGFVKYDWMLQFPSYRQQGRTETSEWDNTLRFAKARLLPPITEIWNVDKGVVYFTEGVDSKKFEIQGERIYKGTGQDIVAKDLLKFKGNYEDGQVKL